MSDAKKVEVSIKLWHYKSDRVFGGVRFLTGDIAERARKRALQSRERAEKRAKERVSGD